MSVKNLATELNHLTIQDELCPECGFNHDSEYESESYSESYSGEEQEEQPQLCEVVGGALQGGAMRRRKPAFRRVSVHRRMGRGMGDTYTQNIDGGDRFCAYTHPANGSKRGYCARYVEGKRPATGPYSKQIHPANKAEYDILQATVRRIRRQKGVHRGTKHNSNAAVCSEWLRFVRLFRAQNPQQKWSLAEISPYWKGLTDEGRLSYRSSRCTEPSKKALTARKRELRAQQGKPIIPLRRG